MGQAEKPRRGWSTIAVGGKTWGQALDSLTLWFLGSGVLLAAGFTASIRTPVEGKIRADTAAWSHGSFKAIRKIACTESARGWVASASILLAR